MLLMCVALATLWSCLGCVSLPLKFTGDISAMNRSNADIRSVIVDSGKGENRFGFLGAGGAGKTRAGCEVDNLRNVTISWSENGVAKTAVLDLSAYAKSASDVGDMTFCYEGKGKWTVEFKGQ
jgi:hypothetical protein